jgi:Plasmid pRiA4b ORF-3-like protein
MLNNSIIMRRASSHLGRFNRNRRLENSVGDAWQPREDPLISLTTDCTIDQLKVVLLGISPMIWRRLLIRSQSTIADLHHLLQIAMGWTDTHLHQFRIQGNWYVPRVSRSERSRRFASRFSP